MMSMGRGVLRLEVVRERLRTLAHVLLHVGELTQAQEYRPAAVQGSDCSSQPASGDQEEALPFVNASARERPNAFRQRLRQLAARGCR